MINSGWKMEGLVLTTSCAPVPNLLRDRGGVVNPRKVWHGIVWLEYLPYIV